MGNLLFLSGSIRKDSFNTKLAQHAYHIAKELGADAHYVDLHDFQMPLYNGDLEAASGLPEAAIRLKQLFIEASGFLIASPEYNSSISPLLKNSLDWISRKHQKDEKDLIAYTGKVAALCAASPGGYGGLRGLVPLRMMLGNIGVLVTPTQLAVPFADKAFNEAGHLQEERQASMLKKVVQQLIDTAR